MFLQDPRDQVLPNQIVITEDFFFYEDDILGFQMSYQFQKLVLHFWSQFVLFQMFVKLVSFKQYVVSFI